MTHMAVIMMLVDHIKDELFCLHKDTKILKMRDIFVETNYERKTEKQGTYIYFDTNNRVWIHSGKVTGRYFLVQHKEHLIKAPIEHAPSCFYLRYPIDNNPNAKSRRISGFFDNLFQFFAIGVYGVDNKEEEK